MGTTKAQARATEKYQKENTRLLQIRLNFKTDKDILEKLGSVPSKAGYIKELIRKDIASLN